MEVFASSDGYKHLLIGDHVCFLSNNKSAAGFIYAVQSRYTYIYTYIHIRTHTHIYIYI